MLFATQTTCANLLRDAGTRIYIYREIQLDSSTSLCDGSGPKTKRHDHTTVADMKCQGCKMFSHGPMSGARGPWPPWIRYWYYPATIQDDLSLYYNRTIQPELALFKYTVQLLQLSYTIETLK